MPPPRADLVVRSDARFEDAVASKPFVFVIGPEQKEFYLHKGAFARLSPAFDAMVNGPMREAQEGRVNWPDLDVSTFVRFAEFVYTGDYTEASPEILAPVMPETIDLTNHLDEEEEDDNLSEEDMSSELGESDFSEEAMDGELSDDDRAMGDNDDDDDDEVQTIDYEVAQIEDDDGSYASAASDTLTNGNWPASAGLEPEAEFYDAFSDPIPVRLPYSIESYAEAVKAYIDNVGGRDCHRAFQGSKRRRLSEGGFDTLPGNVAHRFAAMQRFYKLRIRKQAFFKRSVPRWTPSENKQPNEGFEAVFLSHARLYIFADKYCVDKLRDLTLHRLHMRLLGFQIFPQRVTDLLALVEEVYANTVEEDSARKIICAFFGCIAEHLRSNPDFKSTLKNVPEFAEGLIDEMSRRLE